MNHPIQLLLTAILTTTIGAVLYILLLRKLPFFRVNRLLLLGLLLLSNVVPFIPAPANFYAHTTPPSLVRLLGSIKPQTSPLTETKADANFPWGMLIIAGLYIAGLIFFLTRTIIQFYALRKIIRQSSTVTINGQIIYDTKEELNPFSFINKIVINLSRYREEQLKMIIAHEQVHIGQRHYMDLFMAYLFRIIFWFNPANWMLAYLVKEQIEFETDARILQTGVPRKEYQYHLLRVATQNQLNQLTLSFNFSNLKMRIMMMNKQTPIFAAWRYLLLVLVLVPALFLNKAQAQSKQNKEDQQAIRQDAPATISGDKKERNIEDSDPIVKNVTRQVDSLISSAAEQIKKQTSNTVTEQRQNSSPTKTNTANLDNELPRKVGEKLLEKANAPTSAQGGNIAYFIDGKLTPSEDVALLEPGNIVKMEVYKSIDKLKAYDVEDKDGIVLIYTK